MGGPTQVLGRPFIMYRPSLGGPIQVWGRPFIMYRPTLGGTHPGIGSSIYYVRTGGGWGVVKTPYAFPISVMLKKCIQGERGRVRFGIKMQQQMDYADKFFNCFCFEVKYYGGSVSIRLELKFI